MRIFITICMVYITSFNLWAQNNHTPMITGRIVASATRLPLMGASVYLQLSATSATSGNEGHFTMPLLLKADTMMITYVGYKTAKLLVHPGQYFDVVLEEEANLLQTVSVSTGYQEVTKERSTGSFEKIDNASLNNQVGSDIISRLEGVSNVLFDKSGVRPTLTIRGISSINGSKDPLIILNNFPYEGDINNINPNDIETITILKDAAAASIWGTRAGNGVIVITTKRGKFNQRFSIELNNNISMVQQPDVFYQQRLSSSAFIDLEKFLFSRGFYNNQESSIIRPALSPVVEILIKQRSNQLSNTDAEIQINALKQYDVRNDYNNYLYNSGINQQYALTLRGGSNNIAFILSGGFDKKTDPLQAGYNRLNIRSETVFKPIENLQVTTGLTYTHSTTASGKPSMQSFTQLYPYARLTGNDGTPLSINRYREGYTDTAGSGRLLNWLYTPLEDYTYSRNNTNTAHLLANISLQYRINSDLSFDVRYNYERQQWNRDNLQQLESFYTRDLINRFSQVNYSTGAVRYVIPKGDILDRTRELLQSHNIRSQINYNRSFSKHDVTLMAGAETRSIQTAGYSFRIYGYDPQILTQSNVDYVNPYPNFITKSNIFVPGGNGESEKLNHFVSFFANGAYTFNRRYILSGSMRRDASNLFGVKTNDKWNPLWSAGVGWNISEEAWYKSSLIPSLKLRTTWGYSGNVDQSRSAVTTISYAGLPAPNTNLPYAFVSRYENPQLRWEKVRMWNVGVDFASSNNIISGSIEYFSKKGTDLLGDAPIDYTALGQQYMIMNVAAMKGSGIELTLNSKPINKKIGWTNTLILNYNTSHVTRYFNTSLSASNYLNNGINITAVQGRPVYSIISYAWAGLDSAGNPQGYINGKPSIDYSSIASKNTINDLVYNGPAVPPVYGSLINNVSYRKFALSIAITGRFGHYFRRQSVNYSQLFSYLELHEDYENRWQKQGDEMNSTIPSLLYPNSSARDAFYNNSEILVEKGANIRIQYINLSYAYQPKKPNSVVKNIQGYVNCSNFRTLWQASKNGIDPEYNRQDILPSSTITVGLKTTF